MKLSVVTTLYKSQIFLDRFIEQTLEAISKLQIKEFELLFVNDGSPDNSLEYLLNLKKSIKQITIVDLTRNFGHQYALQVGLQYAKGDYIFLIDNDLETPPKFLIDCYKNLVQDPDLDVVYGYQEKRKGRFVERVGGSLFMKLQNNLSDVDIPSNLLTERLMTKRYVKSLLELGDYNLHLDGMMHWVGYNQKGLPVKKGLREGESTYSFRKRYALMIEALTSFSGKPLEYLFYVGILITISSIITAIYFIVKKIVYGDQIELGWTSLVVINVLILGIITTFLGLMGIYIYKIFKQVQTRPNAIINKIY